MSALREAFVEELRDLLDAEMQLLKALPRMADAAQNDGLRVAFQAHQDQTASQIRRLGQVFEALEEPARQKKCNGMAGLLKEAEAIIQKEEGDAALIGAAQKAEHYEIAAYGTLESWAVALGHDEVVKILAETLEEEKEADKKLTVIAQTVVNSEESRREVEEPKRQRPETRRQQPEGKRPRPQAKRHPSPSRGQSARQRSAAGSSRQTTKSRASKTPRSKRLRASAGK